MLGGSCWRLVGTLVGNVVGMASTLVCLVSLQHEICKIAWVSISRKTDKSCIAIYLTLRSHIVPLLP